VCVGTLVRTPPREGPNYDARTKGAHTKERPPRYLGASRLQIQKQMLFTYTFFLSYIFGVTSTVSRARFLRIVHRKLRCRIQSLLVHGVSQWLRALVADQLVVSRASCSLRQARGMGGHLVEPICDQCDICIEAGCARLCDVMLQRRLAAENTRSARNV